MAGEYLEDSYQFDTMMLVEPIRKASHIRMIAPVKTVLSPSDLQIEIETVVDDPVTAQANLSNKQEANMAHLPPNEWPTIPILVESIWGWEASRYQAFAAAHASMDRGCTVASLIFG